MNDEQLDERLTAAFACIAPPEDALDSVRDAVVQRSARRTGFALVERRRRFRRGLAAVAACLALTLVGFGGYSAWADVVTVVGVDINPSLELSVNRFDVVVGAKGLNADGDDIVASSGLVGMSCEDAVASLLERDDVRAQLDSGSGDSVAIAVCDIGGNRSHSCEEDVAKAASRTGCAVSCVRSEEGEYRASSSVGLTVCKYRAFEELLACGSDITAEEVSETPMPVLRQMIAEAGGDDSIVPGGRNAMSGAQDDGGHRGSGRGHVSESGGYRWGASS